MLDLLQRLTRWRARTPHGGSGPGEREGAPSGTSLAVRLADYPPYAAPHAGPSSRWTRHQAEENLAYLLSQRPHRLKVIRELLQQEGIDTTAVLQEPGPEPEDPGSRGGRSAAALLARLHTWAQQRWPALQSPTLVRTGTWLASRRRDSEIVYSMLMDLALLLGELILRRHPGYHWALDLDEQNRRDGMDSFLRPVLQLDARGSMPSHVVLDLEHLVFSRFLDIHNLASQVLDDWARVVEDAACGRYEATWMAPSPAGASPPTC